MSIFHDACVLEIQLTFTVASKNITPLLIFSYEVGVQIFRIQDQLVIICRGKFSYNYHSTKKSVHLSHL